MLVQSHYICSSRHYDFDVPLLRTRQNSGDLPPCRQKTTASRWRIQPKSPEALNPKPPGRAFRGPQTLHCHTRNHKLRPETLNCTPYPFCCQVAAENVFHLGGLHSSGPRIRDWVQSEDLRSLCWDFSFCNFLSTKRSDTRQNSRSMAALLSPPQYGGP